MLDLSMIDNIDEWCIACDSTFDNLTILTFLLLYHLMLHLCGVIRHTSDVFGQGTRHNCAVQSSHTLMTRRHETRRDDTVQLGILKE